MLHGFYKCFKMPLSFTVHCFSLQIEGTASTSRVYQVCLSAALIHHKYWFPLCGCHLHLAFRMQQSHHVVCSLEALVFSRIQYPFFGILSFLLSYWVYGPPAETYQELLFLRAVWNTQAPEPLSFSCKVQPQSSCRARGCTPASPRLQLLTPGGSRGAHLGLLLFLFPPLIF